MTDEARIFITGAAGALGGALVRHLGARAKGVARHPAPAPHDGRWITADLADAGWIEGSPGAAIVHAAGLSAALARIDAEALAAPHFAMARDLARRGWRGHLVLLSSAAVYGEPASLPVPETAPTSPLHDYGRLKLRIEQGLSDLADRHGFALTILRLANVYGTPLDLPRRRVAALILDALARGAAFTLFGDGSSRRDYLHVDDFAAAVALCLAAPALPPVLNLGGGGGGTALAALISAAEEITGRRLALDRQPPRAEAQASLLDISRASAALGWRPGVDLRQGLQRMWQDRP